MYDKDKAIEINKKLIEDFLRETRTIYNPEEDVKASSLQDLLQSSYVLIEGEKGDSYLDKDTIERIYEYNGKIFIRTKSADLVTTKFNSLEEALKICLM